MLDSTTPVRSRFADIARTVDRAVALQVEMLIEERAELVEETGLSPDVLLAHDSDLTGYDRKALLVAADVLPDLPRLRQLFRLASVKWSQLRPICLAAAKLSTDDREQLDVRLAHAAAELRGADPDALLEVLDAWLGLHDASRERAKERRLEQGEFLHLQPFLDGSGGSLYGQYGAVNFATVSDRIDAAAPKPDVQANPHGDPQTTADNRRTIAQARAEGLLTLCSTRADGEKSRPLLLATVPLASLIEKSRAPGRLLTTLTGGTLNVTALAARRLAETEQGADLRLIVHDEDGRTVGIGRRTRLFPGWIAEAVRANQPRCTHPGCRRPARRSQTDHVKGWTDHGPTEAGNGQPLCESHHTAKTDRHWTATVDPDGSIRWTHRRTGAHILQPSLFRIDRLANGPPPVMPSGRTAS